jgi:ABC-type branched-subunit amino acid transport system substrate-binding protein
LVYPSDESGLGFINAVQAALRDNNITPLYELSYSKGDAAAMLTHVAALEANPPEFIIFGDNLKAAIQFFSAFSTGARKSIIPVGSALWDNPMEVMQSKTILSGAIFVSAFYPDLSKPLVSEFIALYKEKNKKSPDFFAAQGYDAGLLLASSESSPNSAFSPPSQLEGVTGSARATSHGEILRGLTVLRLAHGTIAPLTELPVVKNSAELIDGNKYEDSAEEATKVEPQMRSDPVLSE